MEIIEDKTKQIELDFFVTVSKK